MAEHSEQPKPKRKKKKSGGNVKIYARVRDLMPWEPNEISLEVRGKKIQNTNGNKTNEYLFQNTFETDAVNEDIFKTMVRPMVENVLDGFNAILIAYGQTGSGKTFSMLGKPALNIVGVLPMMLGYLVDQPQVRTVEIAAVEAFGLHVARIELFDLFDPRNQTKHWPDKCGNTSLDPNRAIRVPVTGHQDAHDKIVYAHEASHFAPTGKNPESSRGHVAFITKITADHPTIEHADLISYFVMVDCAGSEGESAFTAEFKAQVDKTTLMGRRLEAGCINTGLSQLQIIFNELRYKGQLSKMVGNGLRRVLHPYVNARTYLSVLFTLSPSVNNSKSTESTLKFAVAAGMVKVQPVKGEAKMNLDSLAKKLRMIIEENDRKLGEQTDVIEDLKVALETERQNQIANGNMELLELKTEETTPTKKRKKRRSRQEKNELRSQLSAMVHERTESSLPAGLLSQLASLDDDSDTDFSSDEELDEMFAVTVEMDDEDVQMEMIEAYERMNHVANSSNLIRSAVALPEGLSESQQLEYAAQATAATLGAAHQSVIGGGGDDYDDDEDDEDIYIPPDFEELDTTELASYSTDTWVRIEEKRGAQESLRTTQKTVVDHLTETNEWLFNALREVLDSSIGQ